MFQNHYFDVVGYSLVAEHQLPRIAFDQLKSILGDISELVHQHGGFVNKNLGDGLLCFFGYSLEDNQSTPDHVEKALECGASIQRRNLKHTLSEFSRGAPIFPLRIGLNTSSVFVGNIGTEDKIDITVVGNGVNLAKRLEGACSVHSVMMGVTSKELLDPNSPFQKGVSKKHIKIKHHDSMVESWEYDPFWNEEDLRNQALEAHKYSVSRVRDERWEVSPSVEVSVSTSFGPARFLNYSRKGLSVSMSRDLPTSEVIDLSLDDQLGILCDELARIGLDKISAEICWKIQSDDNFIYGLKYVDLQPIIVTQIHAAFSKLASAAIKGVAG